MYFSLTRTFSKSILNICKFMVHILLKPGLENFEHCFASVWDECDCAVVWAIRDQVANIHWIIKKAWEFQENIYFCFIDYAKAWLCGSQQTVKKS